MEIWVTLYVTKGFFGNQAKLATLLHFNIIGHFYQSMNDKMYERDNMDIISNSYVNLLMEYKIWK